MNKHTQMIFINLPIVDLPKSKAFYETIGFSLNQKFSDETAACMVLSATIFVMLLTHPKWKQFTTKTIPDAKKTAQVMLCLSRESRAAVDSILEAAKKAGGKADPNPV